MPSDKPVDSEKAPVPSNPTGSLARKETGLSGRIAHMGWVPPKEGMTFEQFQYEFNMYWGLGERIAWVVGDILAYGEQAFGEDFAQVVPEDRVAKQTLLNWARVSRAIEPSRRREGVSWSHHEAVAKFDPWQQDLWLDWVAARVGTPEHISKRALQAALKGDEPEMELHNCPICGHSHHVKYDPNLVGG